MKKEVEYHEVEIRCIVPMREAFRAVRQATGLSTLKRSDVRSHLATVLFTALKGNDTGCLDAEDVHILIDGKPEIGA